MNKISFFQPPSSVNPIKAAGWISLCLILLIILSFFYSFIISVMPIIYFCVLVTIFFPFVFSYIIKYSSKLFGITNKKFIQLSGLFFGLAAFYFSWVSHLILIDPAITNPFSFYISNPMVWLRIDSVYSIVMEINEYGSWSIMNAQINGLTLTAIWLVELIIIVSLPYFFLSKYEIRPYSLRAKKWYKRYELEGHFNTIVLIPKANEEIAKDVKSYMETLRNGETFRHSIASIYYLKEEGKQYISFFNLRYNNEGKQIYNNTAINYQEISKTEALYLIETYNGKKAFFFE